MPQITHTHTHTYIFFHPQCKCALVFESFSSCSVCGCLLLSSFLQPCRWSVFTATGRVLEVTDLPAGISRAEADSLLAELAKAGALIKWLPEQPQHPQRPESNTVTSDLSAVTQRDLASTYTILATFPSKQAAQSALLKLNPSISTFRLKAIQRAGSQ